MIKSQYLEGKEFNSKKELFKSLKDNIDIIKANKSASIKYSNPTSIELKAKSDQNKGVNSITLDPTKSYHVINTTNKMDSHDDVHVNGIWNKSVKDQQGNVFFVTDHELSVSSIIAHKDKVNMSVKGFTWEELGIDAKGSTEAIVFEIDKSDILHPTAKTIIESKSNIEHSVRMSYVTYDLAINDESTEFATEKAVWDSTINLIVNKEDAEKQGYFFRVSEAKIVREGSMVLFGSNDATPILEQEPIKVAPISPKDKIKVKVPMIGI